MTQQMHYYYATVLGEPLPAFTSMCRKQTDFESLRDTNCGCWTFFSFREPLWDAHLVRILKYCVTLTCSPSEKQDTKGWVQIRRRSCSNCHLAVASHHLAATSTGWCITEWFNVYKASICQCRKLINTGEYILNANKQKKWLKVQ